MKFRKKPVEIEAIQYKNNISEIANFIKKSLLEKESFKNGDWVKEFEIETLEGNLTATTGDWIIKGVNGEFYPCKDEIFKKTYDKA